MPTVRYTAQRSLIPGVTAGASRTYVLPVRYAGMSRNRAVFKNTRRSLSGRRETYYESVENSYQVSTKPLTAQQQALLVMFLDSVEQGETFEFAPTDSVFSDAITDGGYDETREPNRDSLFIYSFRITVLP